MEIPSDIPRLRGWLAEHRIRYLPIARELGVSRQYISAVLRETTPVSARQLARIHRAIETIMEDHR